MVRAGLNNLNTVAAATGTLGVPQELIQETIYVCKFVLL